MSDHDFTGIVVGERTMLGVLDGTPRLVVSRPGEPLVTHDATGALTLHETTLADSSKKVFDSEWIGTARILASGSAVPSTTDLVSPAGSGLNFGVIATFANQGFTPIPLVFADGAVWGPQYDSQWDAGWDSSNAPGNRNCDLANRFHTVVTPTKLAVLAGNGWAGYSIPNWTFQYIILGAGIIP